MLMTVKTLAIMGKVVRRVLPDEVNYLRVRSDTSVVRKFGSFDNGFSIAQNFLNALKVFFDLACDMTGGAIIRGRHSRAHPKRRIG